MNNNAPVELNPTVIIGYNHSGYQIPENFLIGGENSSYSSESPKDSNDSTTELDSTMDTSHDGMMPYDGQFCAEHEFDAELDVMIEQIEQMYEESTITMDEPDNDGPNIIMESESVDSKEDDISAVHKIMTIRMDSFDQCTEEMYFYDRQLYLREVYKVQSVLPQFSAMESYDLIDALKTAEAVMELFSNILIDCKPWKSAGSEERFAYRTIRHHLQGYKADDKVYQTSKRYWLREPGVYRRRDGGMKIIDRKDY
jgi:hypothetical protein